MASASVECVWPVGASLGEGPFWSASEQAVWFVDIKGRAIHRYHELTGQRRSWSAPADPGFILPAHDGTLVAGLQSGLHRFDPSSGQFTRLYEVEPSAPHMKSRLFRIVVISLLTAYVGITPASVRYSPIVRA